MTKPSISSFPLIAITELMDMDSGDARCYFGHGSVESTFEIKRGEVESYGWGLDWKQADPVFIWQENGRRVLLNGHHRAVHAHDVGLLFLHYTTSPDENRY